MVYENSRYLQADQYNRLDRNSAAVFTLRHRHEFNQTLMTQYQMIAGDTLDGLAFKNYGDTNLRWVIMDANPQYRTEFDIKVGDYINIPDYDEVWDLMSELIGGSEEV